MPKRKPEQKLAYYREKIRRIQEKENKKMQRRVRVILSDSSDSEENASKCYLFLFVVIKYKCFRSQINFT